MKSDTSPKKDLCAAARYAAVPTKAIEDQFITVSQESRYFQTKKNRSQGKRYPEIC